EGPRSWTARRGVIAAGLVTAKCIWVLHLTRAILHGGVATGVLGWVVMACWTQALNLTAVMVAYAVLNGVTAIAGWTRVPRLWEYAPVVALAAFAISTVFLDVIFPNLAFGEYAPMAMAIVGGVALATTWSGVAVRRPHRAGTEAMSGIDLFVAPVVPIGPSWVCVVALMALQIATFGRL